MAQYNIITEAPESTVVTDYQPLYRKETSFQSEADLEKAFIEQLQTQAYDYLPITSEEELVANLRSQLELLNDYKFTDSEWEQFFKSKIANQNIGIEEKTSIIQEDHIQLLTRDDGTVKTSTLLIKPIFTTTGYRLLTNIPALHTSALLRVQNQWLNRFR